MSYDRNAVLEALADLSEVQRASARLGITASEAATRIEAQLNPDRIRREANGDQDYAYRLAKAAITAARALT